MKEKFGLYLIATDPIAGYEALAQAAVECGVRYLQLRIKNAPHKTILQTAHLYRKITTGTATRFIMNDDLSIAIETDADGIHLGQTDLSISEARQRWNTPGKLFGLSTHNLEQAARAETLRPDYIGIGPVFPTPTKADTAPVLGPEETGRIAQAVALTAVAIGGINLDNLPALRTAGIDNFCVVSAVNAQADPIEAIRRLQLA
ncbi:MAG: thiamine phosphate synthase [Pontiellaceae bacterium]|nr:thiamine phosphate synthase [Pontiellaceae bacterium]